MTLLFSCMGCFQENRSLEENTELRSIVKSLCHNSMAAEYGQSNREGARFRGTVDKCWNNHKLKRTYAFWKIICTDEQTLGLTCPAVPRAVSGLVAASTVPGCLLDTQKPRPRKPSWISCMLASPSSDSYAQDSLRSTRLGNKFSPVPGITCSFKNHWSLSATARASEWTGLVVGLSTGICKCSPGGANCAAESEKHWTGA